MEARTLPTGDRIALGSPAIDAAVPVLLLDQRFAVRPVDGDGDTIAVGAYYDRVGTAYGVGAVYVFTRSGTTWTQQARLTGAAAYEYMGYSVGISGEQTDRCAAGASNASSPHAGAAFRRNAKAGRFGARYCDGPQRAVLRRTFGRA